MINTPKKSLFAVIISLFLTGCGFTTHNVNSLPPQLRQVYYQTERPNDPLEINFKKRLKTAGLNILTEPTKSSLTLTISSSYGSAVNNPASSTQARVYDIHYSAVVTISDFYNKQLVTPQTATAKRSITLQPNEVFEATSQISLVKRELQQELVIKILNILSARKTFQALAKFTP